MKAVIKIEMENAAFEKDAHLEISRILTRLSRHVNRYPKLVVGQRWRLKDINGNTVGQFEIVE